MAAQVDQVVALVHQAVAAQVAQEQQDKDLLEDLQTLLEAVVPVAVAEAVVVLAVAATPVINYSRAVVAAKA
jgi:hypothetical protein